MRYPACVNYELCLADHGHLNSGFDCGQACRGFLPGVLNPSLDDLTGSLALITAVFQPKIYSGMNRAGRRYKLLKAFLAGLSADTPPLQLRSRLNDN